MSGRPVVYYDGGCPVCSREIGAYQKQAASKSFDWVDVTCADSETLGPGLTREKAMARMHVRRADGTLASGAAAFAEIWRGFPALRWLGVLLGLPPFGAMAELGYRAFLKIRTTWR
jgi:predicted DCC family thiol-disulfide oxidoreductase YuxK